MKVTITFDTDEEKNKFLDSSRVTGLTTKEAIEAILSTSLIEALRSPFLRRIIRGQIPLELAKKKA